MKKTSWKFLVAAAVMAAGLALSSVTGVAFAHSHIEVTPDKSDHNQMNARPVVLTLGHSNEPAFAAKPGMHDGRHDFELSIEDAATALPLSGADLKLDRYYFSDILAFSRASSPQDSTEVDHGIALRGVFGEPGIYSVRQVVKEGIYGYRVYGTIDYFGVAKIPVDSTIFCATPAGNTSKFTSPGWQGSFGCIEDMNSLLFPENNSEVRRIASGNDDWQPQQAALAGAAASGGTALSWLQTLAVGATATVGGFFGLRAFRQHKQQQGL
jgi:hypothetical protein